MKGRSENVRQTQAWYAFYVRQRDEACAEVERLREALRKALDWAEYAEDSDLLDMESRKRHRREVDEARAILNASDEGANVPST